MKQLHRLEDAAVRVMYFFNVTDTFLPFSVIAFVAALQAGAFSPWGVWPLEAPLWQVALSLIAYYACCRLADLHLFYLAVLPAAAGIAIAGQAIPLAAAAAAVFFFFALTSLIQIVFMGLPMAMASRSPDVALRMYINSFAILAPTTISLPVTLGYQFLLTTAVMTTAPQPLSKPAAATAAVMVAGALATRRLKKRAFLPPTHHPAPNPPGGRRAVVLNLDGVSHHGFSRADAPFLHSLEKNFAAAPGGAHTVYKAFTNPAFASILSGAEPAVHRVVNNNFGQPIRAEALPDLLKTRLYGSMHVKHFSKKAWKVNLVSLVELAYDRADAALMETLKEDLLRHPDTRLWVVDLSLADYCGHAWGSYSHQYRDAIAALDRLIKDFFCWCRDQGLLDDTLFVLSSDHGLFIGEHAYILSAREERVPLVFIGDRIAARALPEKTSIMDIAANISYFLAKPYCRESRGRVFESIYDRQPPDTFARRLGIEKNHG